MEPFGERSSKGERHPIACYFMKIGGETLVIEALEPTLTLTSMESFNLRVKEERLGFGNL